MGILDSFKPRKLVVGSPYLSVTTNGVSLNKSAIDRLEYAEFVKLLVDEQNKRLAIQISNADDVDKVAFVNPKKKKDAQYVRWNTREFTKQLLDWAPNLDLRNNGFKIPGHYYPNEKAFIFVFSEAVSL